MPIYEYRCTACGHRFEERQGFNDPPRTACPKCQGSAQRVIGAVGVVFKGSGFYSTDSRRSSSAGVSSSKSKNDSGNGDGHDHAHGAGSHTHGSNEDSSSTSSSETTKAADTAPASSSSSD